MRLAKWTVALTIGCLTGGAFGQSAREEGQPAQPPPRLPEPRRVEPRRVEVRPAPGAGQGIRPPRVIAVAAAMEKGAWLGVTTSPPPHVLRLQLQLPKGVGLVADMVAPDSPAEKAGVRQYDVLHKLNDQILINQQQLAVLVRTFKPGDEVKLTVIRDGKPQELSAKLVERELRPLEEMRLGAFGGGGGGVVDGFELQLDRNFPDPFNRGDNDFRLPRPLPPGEQPRGGFFERRAPGANLLDEGATLTWDDGSLAVTLTNKGGKRHLRARDKAGKVLFDGPIDSEEQRQNLPEEVRRKLEQVRFFGPGGGPFFGPREGPATRPSTRPARQGVAPGAKADELPGDVLFGIELRPPGLPDDL